MGNISEEIVGDDFEDFDIHANDQDVRSYLTKQLSQTPNLARRPDLCDHIITEIIEKSAKMFLLAKSLLNEFVDSTCRRGIQDTIATLSERTNKINWLYDDAMKRVKSQGYNFQNLAVRVLAWLTFARRPLKVEELQYALAAETQVLTIDIDRFPNALSITSVCAGLVMVDEKSQCFCFTHYTIKEYLENSVNDWYPEAKNYVARTCIKYLSLPTFRDGHLFISSKYKDDKYDFYSYTATNWGHHVLDGTLSYQSEVIPFMKSKNAKESIRVMKPQVTNVSLVHLIAHFGLDDIVPLLTQQDRTGLNSKDSEGNTPLAWATSQGHENMVKVLLSMGVDVDSKDHSGATPLSKAACNGHSETVKLLLEYGAALEAEDYEGMTVLSRVAKSGDVNMMRLLLANGARLDTTCREGWTPIFYAAASGHEEKVQMLTEEYEVDVLSEDYVGRTPIFIATMEGHKAMVGMFIDRYNVSPDWDDEEGRSLVSYAAEGGHTAIFKLLLEKHFLRADGKDSAGRDALSWAARYGRLDLVRLFIDNYKVDPNSRDVDGRTALMWAAYDDYDESSAKGRHEVVQALVEEYNVDKEPKDGFGDTALSFAMQNGDEEMVKLLTKS
ncbi:hypothetical protein AWENTII_011757 [Aspergillus wentii]